LPASRVLLSSAGMRPVVTRYSVKPSTPRKPSARRARRSCRRSAQAPNARRCGRCASQSVTNAGFSRHVVERRDRAERLSRAQLEVQRVAVATSSATSPRSSASADRKTAPEVPRTTRARAWPRSTPRPAEPRQPTPIQIVRRDTCEQTRCAPFRRN
jgi:hypothetical protein